MKLIFIHGLPGVGKYTVGRSLQKLTNYRLFHNHLVVDTLLSVFEFGTDQFVRLREHFWLQVFSEAAASGISCIFTFAPEKTVDPSFIQKTVQMVEDKGGKVIFVQLTCDSDELEVRIKNPSRKQFGKLQSVTRWKELEGEGAYVFPPIESDIALDTSSFTAEDSAQVIYRRIAEC